MADAKARRIGVKIDDLEISSFFNEGFVKDLREGLEGAVLTHFCIVLEKKGEEKEEKDTKKYELVHISHDAIEDMKGKRVSIKADDPETFEKVYAIVEKTVR
ncbi:MAG: hypothetical protein KAW09_01060 [Thermoplasmata archaeon]|nr:hypothetical protein [Thermoplasmata archaeon]